MPSALNWKPPNAANSAFEERFALLVDQQWLWKENRALAHRLRAAHLKERGVMEDVDYQHPRGLDRKLMRTLASSDWVRQHQNILLIGPTGIGKSLARHAHWRRRPAGTGSRCCTSEPPNCSANWR